MISYDICIFIAGVIMCLSCWLGVVIGKHAVLMRVIDYFLYRDLTTIEYTDIIKALEYAQGKMRL